LSVEKWSDHIIIAELQDDPAFSDDLATLLGQLETENDSSVVLRFSGVNYINSSNIAKLLKLRKMLLMAKHRLVLCEIDTKVWGLFLVTGLDKVFEFADDLGTALTSLQIPMA
jgi:anti-anti-sigma factor